MGNASRLVRAMQIAGSPKENQMSDLIVGTVLSVSPLIIKTDKLELTQSFLILSALCKESKIKVPVSINGTTNETILSDVTLWRGLRVGDVVYMLRCRAGQKYYVLQRKEGIE